MKKPILIISIMIVLLTFAGCRIVSKDDMQSSEPSSKEQSTSIFIDDVPSSEPSSKEQSDNILLNLNIITANVMNGFGDEVLGQRAYIMMDKDTLRNLPEKDFIELVNKVIDGSGYNYFSIRFNDDTGIQFPGSMKEIATYGTLTDDDSIDEEIGHIELKSDGTYSYVETRVE